MYTAAAPLPRAISPCQYLIPGGELPRNTRGVGAAVVAALLTAGLTTGAASGAPGSGSGAGADTGNGATAGRQERPAPSVVTLITGDRVHLDAKGQVTRIQRGEGREHVRIAVKRAGGATYAIPSDAAKLIARGTLDRRLFNVTALVEDEYDDAHRNTLPLIVSYNASKARAKAAFSAADVAVRRTLPAVRGEALTAPKAGTAEVWRALTAPGPRTGAARTAAPGIERVWLDGRRKAALDKSAPQIGAPAAWQAGYDGTGVKVAVLDTGVDETHPDLKNAEIAQKDFSGSGNTVDHVGHGTHVASTVAGSGARSGGSYKGVAPGAKILDGKVLDDAGFGDDSGIIAGMQWAADQGAKVANLSLGGEDTTETDPLEAAVDRLSAEKGILFVIAAGNEGPGEGTIGSPGSAASALTVGAVDHADRIADFSSTGPTADGSLKPDITAPGVDIVAAKAAQGELGDPAADGYVSMSGTSMATPHVAGAAALLAQQHPDWPGQRIKQTLTASAKPTPGLTAGQQGTGRTDLTRAITQTVVSEQTSVSFEGQPWPHTDDTPVTKSLTYRNTGKEPVTLDLSLETVGPKGAPAPAGFFALGARRVTVPAGGTESVTLTADTRVGDVDGAFSGAVVARADEGGQSVRTTFGAHREVESYDLTLKFIDTKGRPAQTADTTVYGHDTDFWKDPADTDGDGVTTLRVPKGDFLVSAAVETPVGGDAEPEIATMARPKLWVTRDTTLTFDARRAEPVNITAPESARPGDAYHVFKSDYPGGRGLGSSLYLDSFKGYRTGQVGAPAPAKEFSSQLGGVWQKGSTSYNLLYSRTGSLHTGLTHRATPAELARVDLKVGASAKKAKGWVNGFWNHAGYGIGTGTASFPLPATAKTYVTTPKGFSWEFNVGQDGATEDDYGLTFRSDPAREYVAGRTYTKTYNVGVFGPRVGGEDVARRLDNQLAYCINEFTDGAGHSGSSEVSAQRTVVTVGGKKIIDEKGPLCSGADGLPAPAATYRVSTEATRSTAVAGVTTRLSAAWSFTSKRTTGEKPVTLPLSTVRFHPKLDLTSTAPAGKKVTVPLSLQGPAAGKGLKSLAVQVSYDGGKKWAEAPVATGKDGARSLALNHPKNAKSVSFKAKLTDRQGNTYDVTVIKAYLLE